jgi:hypothetical protein
MGHSVTITTPIPTLEEVGKRLNMSKARQQRLIAIVSRSSASGRFVVDRHSNTIERNRDASGSVDRNLRSGNSAMTDSSHSKKR